MRSKKCGIKELGNEGEMSQTRPNYCQGVNYEGPLRAHLRRDFQKVIQLLIYNYTHLSKFKPHLRSSIILSQSSISKYIRGVQHYKYFLYDPNLNM